MVSIHIKKLKCTVLLSSRLISCFEKANVIIFPDLLYVPPFFLWRVSFSFLLLLIIIIIIFIYSFRHLVAGFFQFGDLHLSKVENFLVFSVKLLLVRYWASSFNCFSFIFSLLLVIFLQFWSSSSFVELLFKWSLYALISISCSVNVSF